MSWDSPAKDTVGKGSFYLLLARGTSVVTGYIVHLVLGRYLSPALYGTFGIILSLTANIGVLILSGLPDTVSKYVAEDFALVHSIKNTALKLQAVSSLLVFILYVCGAGMIGKLLNDTNLAGYLRFSAVMIPLFAFYSIFINLLNGLKRFKLQSVAIIAHEFIRMAAIVALVVMGFSINGAISGLILSSFSGLLISWAFCRFEPTDQHFQAAKLIRFAIPSTISACTYVLFINVDLLCLKALTTEGALTGFYTAARVLSQPPSIIGHALAVVLFPSVSRSHASGEILQTRQYISQFLRSLLLFLTPIVVLISATSENLILWVYPDEFSQAGKALSILIVSHLFFACFLILVTIISGTGHPRISMWIALFMLLLAFLLNLIMIPLHRLTGASLAILLSTVPGVVLGGIYVYRKFKILIPFPSLIRILTASGILYILVARYPASGAYLLAQYAVFFVLYVFLLFLLRELGSADFKYLKEMLRTL